MRRFWISCIIAVLFPYIVTLAVSGGINGIRQGAGQNGILGGAEAGSGKTVYLEGRGSVDGEEYLVGVLARQMPADYEMEALKAQAIAARTFLYRQMGDRDEIRESELNLEGMGEEQMEKMWGVPRFL